VSEVRRSVRRMKPRKVDLLLVAAIGLFVVNGLLGALAHESVPVEAIHVIALIGSLWFLFAWLRRFRQPQPRIEGPAAVGTLRPAASGGAECDRCHKQLEGDVSSTTFLWVVTIGFPFRGRRQGVWCNRCRQVEKAEWTLVTLLLGWWGPWGPVWTYKALAVNLGFGGSTSELSEASSATRFSLPPKPGSDGWKRPEE
jgi:hypothetical protein